MSSQKEGQHKAVISRTAWVCVLLVLLPRMKMTSIISIARRCLQVGTRARRCHQGAVHWQRCSRHDGEVPNWCCGRGTGGEVPAGGSREVPSVPPPPPPLATIPSTQLGMLKILLMFVLRPHSRNIYIYIYKEYGRKPRLMRQALQFIGTDGAVESKKCPYKK